VTGRARVMQETDPRKVRPIFKGKVRDYHPMWFGNPRIAHHEEKGDFQVLIARDEHDLRPYHLQKTALRWYFNPDFRPDVGEIYFTDQERHFGAHYPNRIILEPHIKSNASPNKRWPWVRWNKLAWLMQKAGMRVTQLGPIGTQILDGAEHIVTKDFRTAAAVLMHARAAVLPEGGLHHAAAALGVPAVVLFGGLTPVELTGYPMHINIGASFGDECGMRTLCEHCKAWMESIKPEKVFSELERILEPKEVQSTHAQEANALYASAK
jgi:ADP-heptose:LPS heptosyltransferase